MNEAFDNKGFNAFEVLAQIIDYVTQPETGFKQCLNPKLLK